MNLNQFIAKYDGKGIDFDGHFGNQCVDLYRQYVKEVLGFPQSPGVEGARNIWDTYLASHYERIANTPTGIPQSGDVIIWGAEYGRFGHIAIVTDANVNTFNCFSQNDPVGTPSRVRRYNSYKGVLGWLRPKAVEAEVDLGWLRQMFLEYNAVDVYKSEGEVRGKAQEVFDGFKKYNELSKKIETLEKELAGAKGEAAENEERLRISERSLSEVRKEVDELQDRISRRDTEISDLIDKLNKLQEAIDPETKIIISKDEWERLQSRKHTDRLTDREVIVEAIRRLAGHFSPKRIIEIWEKDKEEIKK